MKLLDFGLAKAGTEPLPSAPTDVGLAKTETLVTSDRTRIMGTVEYMSPEQALGKSLDVRSDVFSFGIVLYEMLAGVRPFRGLTPGEVLVAVVRDAAPPLRWGVPGVDEATDALVTRCLEKAPAARFASAADIVAALGGRSSSAMTGARPHVGMPGRRARTVGVVAALLLFVAAAGVVKLTATRRAEASRTAAAAPAAPRATAITDLPPLPTTVPAAAREYAQAMQARRDASIAASNTHLLRAAELDPGFALAHLMLALSGVGSTEEQRKHLASAVELRGRLGERDAAVLEIVQAVLGRDRPDVGQDMRRWKALADRYPLDAHIVFLAGSACIDAGLEAEGFALLDRTLALDPGFALPLHDRAVYAFTRGDFEGAIAAADRCLALSPSAASCLRRRAEAEQRLGRCARLEEDAHRMVALEPEGERSYDWLATALVARGAPTESILEAYRRAREHAATTAAKAQRAVVDPAHVALYAGDFVGALAALPAMEGLAASQTNETSAAFTIGFEAAVYEELGKADRAADAAEAYLRRLPALTPDDLGYGRAAALRARASRRTHVGWRVPGEAGVAGEQYVRAVAAPPRQRGLAHRVRRDGRHGHRCGRGAGGASALLAAPVVRGPELLRARDGPHPAARRARRRGHPAPAACHEGLQRQLPVLPARGRVARRGARAEGRPRRRVPGLRCRVDALGAGEAPVGHGRQGARAQQSDRVRRVRREVTAVAGWEGGG